MEPDFKLLIINCIGIFISTVLGTALGALILYLIFGG